MCCIGLARGHESGFSPGPFFGCRAGGLGTLIDLSHRAAGRVREYPEETDWQWPTPSFTIASRSSAAHFSKEMRPASNAIEALRRVRARRRGRRRGPARARRGAARTRRGSGAEGAPHESTVPDRNAAPPAPPGKRGWPKRPKKKREPFQEESYRNLERSLNAPVGVAAGKSSDDAEIIRRVIRAYKSDPLPGTKPTAIWESSTIPDKRPFMRSCLSNDHTAIENLLRRPGNSNLFFGFDNLFIDRVRRLKQSDRGQADAYLAKHAKRQLDKLLHCAEIMGALRCENPESGVHKYASIPLDSLLEAIDQRLGVRLNSLIRFLTNSV